MKEEQRITKTIVIKMSHVLLLVWWQWKCEKWSDYRYILNVEYKGLTDGLNVVAKRKKRKQG